MTAPNTEAIRTLNDAFRSTFIGGNVVVTRGISALGNLEALIDQVQRYDNFAEDSDPHGEHDFGSLVFEREKIFWKIDYYDSQLDQGSPDPADASQTTRVLTVMLASEY